MTDPITENVEQAERESFEKGYFFGAIIAVIILGVLEAAAYAMPAHEKIIGGVLLLGCFVAYYRWYK